MRNKIVLFCALVIVIFSCSKNQPVDASIIINKAIEVSGGNLIDSSNITFDFRDKIYKAKRQNNQFLFKRITVKGSDSIFDLLDNKGFERYINEERISVPDSMVPRYSASVNSVHYFSVLPYGLNNKAVNKEFLGIFKVKESTYFKIKVTFNKEGGGEDFEDVFIYWVNTKSYKVDYLAYSYKELDGLGLRFREAFNERYIEGIRFVDYNNYKSRLDHVELEDLDTLFEKGELTLLSKIELENLTVD